MYGQGPPSVHSSHGGRAYQQQGRSIVISNVDAERIQGCTNMKACIIGNSDSNVSGMIFG